MILITGSEGFIGKHLAARLSNITRIDRKIGYEVLDLTEKDLEGVDCVIHLAAQTSVWNADYQQIIDDNIKAFSHIFFLCRKMGIKFIFTSSSTAINATSLYGITKAFDEQLATVYNYGVGLRLHNVYGPNSREDTLLGICLKNDTVTLYNNGQNIRHFTYIEDVCMGIVMAMYKPDGIYNICNPSPCSTYDFCKEVQKYKPLDIKLIPDIRELDRESQRIDQDTPSLLNKYVQVDEGILKIFK